MRRRIFTLAGTAIFAIYVVLGLFLFSLDEDQSQEISRLFKSGSLKELNQTKDLQGKLWYIAGFTNHHIYLGNRAVINHLKQIDITSDRDSNFSLQHQKFKGILYQRPLISVDSPYYHIYDGNLRVHLKGNFYDSINADMDTNTVYHNLVVPTADGYIFRYVEPAEGFCLGIKSDSFGRTIKVCLLKGQGEDIFTKDGQLHYDNETKKVVYVYSYRNQFIVADSNLKLLYTGKTIDTISIAKIKLGKPDRKGNLTMAAPLRTVNKKSCVDNGRLYILSPTRSKSETKDDFRNNSVIDVYDLTKGSYQFSFYVSNFNGKRIGEFKVKDNVLVALYDDCARIFNLE